MLLLLAFQGRLQLTIAAPRACHLHAMCAAMSAVGITQHVHIMLASIPTLQ